MTLLNFTEPPGLAKLRAMPDPLGFHTTRWYSACALAGIATLRDYCPEAARIEVELDESPLVIDTSNKGYTFYLHSRPHRHAGDRGDLKHRGPCLRTYPPPRHAYFRAYGHTFRLPVDVSQRALQHIADNVARRGWAFEVRLHAADGREEVTRHHKFLRAQEHTREVLWHRMPFWTRIELWQGDRRMTRIDRQSPTEAWGDA